MIIKKVNESSLLERISVINSNSKTLGGYITFVEGDVLEVTFSAGITLALGERVNVTIYSSEGLIAFESNLIATYFRSILCLIPVEIQKTILNRKKEIRLPMKELTCDLISIQHPFSRDNSVFDPHISCNVEYLSLTSITFLIEIMIPIHANDKIRLALANMEVDTSVKYVKGKDGATLIAAEFVEPDKKVIHFIRTMIVKQQAEIRETFVISNSKSETYE